MIRNVVLLFGMSLLTVTVRAQQLYVAPNGSDANNGTSPSAPWRTIQKAMNSATPGSTVNIVAGTYNERLTVGVSGTAGNYITFQPYNFSVPSGGCGGYTGVTCGGDQVILDYGYLGTVTDGIPFLDIEGKSYIRIQGLTFQNLTCLGSMQQGVKIASSSNYIDILQNKFRHNQNNGAWDGTNALLHIYVRSPASNITVRGNEFGYIVSNYSETLSLYAITGTVVLENNYL